ncbi:MAG: alpha/beta hydrolase [Rickettsiaceae bacterium]
MNIIDNEYPEILPIVQVNKKLLVMLHGVGSDGGDLISLVPFMQQQLDNYHFMAPHGIEQYDMAPYGRQWFSLQDRSAPTIRKLIYNNADKVQQIITTKQDELGLTNAETVVLGFSQGTMISSYLTFTQKTPYAAMIALSGIVCPPDTINNNTTPICIVHGVEDQIIHVDESKKFVKYCKEHNIPYQIKLIDNLGHSIDMSGLEFVVNFIKNL